MRITLNNKNVIFVRKDKTLFENKHKVIKEHKGYVYVDKTEGISVLPYRFVGKDSKMEVLIREEWNPIHGTILTVISGHRDDHEDGHGWWKETAQRELGEESGYWVDDKNRFSDLGKVISKKSYKDKDTFVTVNLTGVEKGKSEPQGKIEKKSENFWVSVDLLKRMFTENNNNVDSYFFALSAKFMSFMGLLDKSEEVDLLKAVETKKTTGSKRGPSKLKGQQKPGHKYIRREGQSGEYKYIYTEPKGEKGEKDDGKPKGILAQLVEALGKKTGETKEKSPPKLKPLEEFARVKEPIPDFKKGVTAEQWLNTLDADVINNLINVSTTYKTNTSILSVKSLMDRAYIYSNPSLILSRSELFSIDEINVENKKLDDRASILIKKAVSQTSRAYSVIEYYNGIMNSSATENIFKEAEEIIASIDEQENVYKDVYKEVLNNLFIPVTGLLNGLNSIDGLMKEVKPLAKEDPKLGFMIDRIYESVDSLMKSRDRYIEDAVVFFINQIEPKINDMNNWYTFKSALSLIDGLQKFNELAINSSTIAAYNENFANQWNLKQKGIYDGVSKYLSNSIGKVINTYREVEKVQGSEVLDDIGIDFIEKDVFNFISLRHDQGRRFSINEQAFSYIDHFGLDRYYQDIVYMSGIYDRVHESIPSKVRAEGALERVERAYNGIGGLPVKNNILRTSADGIISTIMLLNPKSSTNVKVDSFIAVWSNASHGSLMTNAIEEMVNSKAIDRESYVNYHLASNRTVMARRPEIKESLANAIDVVYSDTQNVIKKDYDDKIFLFRGNGSSEAKSVASSWTWKEEEALKFGDHITEAEVPHEAVLMFASPYNHADAWEYKDEGEFVVVPGLLPPSQKIKTRPMEQERKNKAHEKENQKIDELADYIDTFGDTY